MSEKSLAAISSAISRKLHWFVGSEERAILDHTKKTIDVIEHTLRGFLKAGLINQRLEAEYLEALLKSDAFLKLDNKTKNSILKLKEKYDQNPLPPLTQEALIEEAHEVQKAMHIFTLAMVKNLLDYLTAQKQTAQSTFLQWIVTVLRNMISPYESPEEKESRPKIKFKDDSRQLDTYTESDYEDTFFSPNVFNHTIHLMGGRYYPFSQSLDSLTDVDAKGFCYGHVLTWHDLIKQKGHFNALPHLDTNTFYYQTNQRVNNIIHSNTQWTYNFSKHTPSLPIVKDILRNMRDDRVYMLSKSQFASGHAMGIRRIPNSTAIEFYDPNFGIIVFDDPLLFENWFKGFLCNYMTLKDQPAIVGMLLPRLILQDFGPQPKNAKPSIPNVTWTSTTTETLFEQLVKSPAIALVNVSSGIEHIKAREIFSSLNENPSPLKQRELEIFKTLGALDLIPNTKHASEVKDFAWFQEEIDQFITKKSSKHQTNNLHNFLEVENQNAKMHQTLNQNITAKIDLEIQRLKKSIIGNYSEKVFALETLKQEILKANPVVPLNIIVTHWLRTKSTMSDKTHAEIIGTQRLFNSTLMTNTEEFIRHLVKENEISTYKLSLLRERICLVASQMLGFNDQLTSEQILNELNSNRVPFANDMKKLFSCYDSNNPTKLNDVYYQLVNIENKQKVQLEQKLKASPSNHA